nr:uncharacterized protein LOC106623222 isoform X2 [Bactrocera oleae]
MNKQLNEVFFCFPPAMTLGAVNETSSFRGFRKQFSGRFKRFVLKQPKTSNSTIPPELKPQLKAIYVY